MFIQVYEAMNAFLELPDLSLEAAAEAAALELAEEHILPKDEVVECSDVKSEPNPVESSASLEETVSTPLILNSLHLISGRTMEPTTHITSRTSETG